VGPNSEDKTAPTVGFIDQSLYHMGTVICILLFVTTAEKRNKSRLSGPRMTKKSSIYSNGQRYPARFF
jgi:hypothetical protein